MADQTDTTDLTPRERGSRARTFTNRIATSDHPAVVTYRRRATAYHEAGHAVAAFLELGVSAIRTVTIKPDDEAGTAGQTLHAGFGFRPDDLDESDLSEHEKLGRIVSICVIAWAGNEAQKAHGGRYDWIGSEGDTDRLEDYALAACGSEAETQAFIMWIMQRTSALLRTPSALAMTKAIAEALLERETLTGDEVAQIARQAVLAVAPTVDHSDPS